MPSDADAQEEQPKLALPQTRGYQQEMLDESLKKNIVIALDTGAGKTHIAVLRMKLECEQPSSKVSWFLTPTVALCHQQHEVIKSHLPVSVGMISGANEPDQWKDQQLWVRVLRDHKIIVSTHDVLLNALRHGYISMGRSINLIIFDEAHHAADNHPYNKIMQEFYFTLPKRALPPMQNVNTEASVRPMVLGLTASPVFGGDIEKAFRKIESNLDCVIRAPLLYREELAGFVHRPEFKYVIYATPNYYYSGTPPSSNLVSLQNVVNALNIDDDPYVHSLREKLTKLPPGPERDRTDQKLSKTIRKRDSYTNKGLRDFLRAADDICVELGEWAADWYIEKVLEQARGAEHFMDFTSAWSSREHRYLMDALNSVVVTPVSYEPSVIVAKTSDKVQKLVDTILSEKKAFEEIGEEYRGLVFVTRRDAVLALTELLLHHPGNAGTFQVGSLLGNSESTRRHSFLDITKKLLRKEASETLRDFKIGDLNLIIATAVAEEGLDIQACCNVTRWDPPPNMVSWAQSRGRARKQRSTFVLMFSDQTVHHGQVKDWEDLEQEMVRLYHSGRTWVPAEQDDDPADNNLLFRVESTGALLTLNSAVEHLEHFCAVLPGAGHGSLAPIYDIDPPEYPAEWHSRGGEVPQYLGPYGCTVTLPRIVDPSFRVFTTPCVHSRKVTARRHVAFQAYLALYEKGLLNDHLLPLTSVLEPELEDEVKDLLKEVDKRDGVAKVTRQMDPWLLPTDSEDVWWPTELTFQGHPSLRLLTRIKPSELRDEEMPILYTPDYGAVKVTLRTASTTITPFLPSDTLIMRAREYTRRILWPVYGSRMKWEDTDFMYLFLPTIENVDGPWEERRKAQSELPTMLSTSPLPLFAPADWFGKKFSHPGDVAMVSEIRRFGKPYRFVRWRMKRVSEEEAEDLVARYAPDDGELEITYPLIEVKPLTKRMNFLLPPPPEDKGDDAASQQSSLLLPEFSNVVLISRTEVKYSLWLPSVLRAIAIANTVCSMRDTILAGTPLTSIPLPLLTTATTAPGSQAHVNYQRLETLGDTVLKYITSIQLLAEFPLWHEGYLARRKDHTVSNARLAKAAVRKQLYKWIIRDRFSPKKWKPLFTTVPEVPVETPEVTEAKPEVPPELEDKAKRRKRLSGELSTKVLADVVESLIGAAYIHGKFDYAIECIRVFDIGISLRSIPERVDAMLSRVIKLEFEPSQLSRVEDMLGYTFKRKALLIEALTHASYQGDLEVISYERMEFLGDCVLDMIVTDYLYHAPGKQYSPGHIHLRKTAVVNAHFLALICLRTYTEHTSMIPKVLRSGKLAYGEKPQRVYLWQCLMHSNARLLDQQNIAFARWQTCHEEIERQLSEGKAFPWALLTYMQAPKFFSDMVESMLGAVFLDSGGDLDVARGVLEKLGIMRTLEYIVKSDMDVQHPVSRLGLWAAKQDDAKVIYDIKREGDMVSCTVFLNRFEEKEELVSIEDEWRGRSSQEHVRFAAADKAMELLESRATAESAWWQNDDAGWGDDNVGWGDDAAGWEDDDARESDAGSNGPGAKDNDVMMSG
ncbi:P-loop containing nucleoside triphosphate hydrolase protein [Dentipellis sp. KUC8613]|nr:P-loop containing nucleoside triphosphate hydrolase protein [Dentipellis sp. KUC8613]